MIFNKIPIRFMTSAEFRSYLSGTRHIFLSELEEQDILRLAQETRFFYYFRYLGGYFVSQYYSGGFSYIYYPFAGDLFPYDDSPPSEFVFVYNYSESFVYKVIPSGVGRPKTPITTPAECGGSINSSVFGLLEDGYAAFVVNNRDGGLVYALGCLLVDVAYLIRWGSMKEGGYLVPFYFLVFSQDFICNGLYSARANIKVSISSNKSIYVVFPLSGLCLSEIIMEGLETYTINYTCFYYFPGGNVY